jgi:hypothetical protein
LYDQNVTPDVLFGTGNNNGSWTVDRNSTTGVELGLRAKVRGANTFNSQGNGTYIQAPGTVSGGASWNFEWSVNTDWNGLSGLNLNDLTYVLRMDNNPGLGTTFTSFDPINAADPNTGNILWDHGIGNNTTGNGLGDNDAGRNVATYAALIAGNNVAQNSWRPHFYYAFDPNVEGTYTFQLEAFQAGASIGMTEMTVVVPEPSTYIAGALLLLPFGASTLRMLRKSRTA